LLNALYGIQQGGFDLGESLHASAKWRSRAADHRRSKNGLIKTSKSVLGTLLHQISLLNVLYGIRLYYISWLNVLNGMGFDLGQRLHVDNGGLIKTSKSILDTPLYQISLLNVLYGIRLYYIFWLNVLYGVGFDLGERLHVDNLLHPREKV